jgi:hypothetical protein
MASGVGSGEIASEGKLDCEVDSEGIILQRLLDSIFTSLYATVS